MLKRQAINGLERLAGQFPVVAIVGPRQSGKSTLAKMAFPKKKYISFDDKHLREAAQANPQDFLLAFPDGAIFDEAQKVPEIFDALKFFVDKEQHTPGKYILTGSSQFRLKENITDSLAGRVGLIKLLPFSLQELKENNLLYNNPYDLAVRGFYPPLYDKAKKYLRDDWFENYLDTYLDLDVKDKINPGNVKSFRNFLKICALYSGQNVNLDGISRMVGVSGVTIKTWLSVLEASFIVHFLEPDFNNLGKTLVKSPKLYFVDVGLMCYLLGVQSKEDLILHDHKGAIIETMAVAELLKERFNEGKRANLSYFRDRRGFEVDLLADWQNSYAIEIKSTIQSEQKLSKNVRKYLQLKGDNTIGRVYYLSDLTLSINDIEYVGWRDWGSQDALKGHKN